MHPVIYTKNASFDQKLTQYRYDAFRNHLFRYHAAQKRNLIEQLELERDHTLLQFNYLFDWGLRWKFNTQFGQKWIEIVEQDPKFKKHGLKIRLQSIHCYTSKSLLCQ
jgi:hypothetical protein